MENSNVPSKSFIQWLSNLKSQTNGTSLVTYYIPGGYSISLITKKINAELSTGNNIKDKNVSKAVLTALKSASLLLKTYKLHNAPENGLVLCAGETGSYF